MRMSAGDKIFGVLRSPGRRLDASWGDGANPPMKTSMAYRHSGRCV